jgi:hypothetical protein
VHALIEEVAVQLLGSAGYELGDSEWWIPKDDATEEMLDAQLNVTAARL